MTDDEVLECVLADRFSCRAFLADIVPTATIRRMFELAQYTASWCNSQAWQVYLTSGLETEAFGKVLRERAVSGPEAPDIPGPAAYEGVYRDRRREAGFGLYGAMGITRDDQAGRDRQLLENFRFFGAPHVAVISSPRALGVYGAVDCGGYVATLMAVAQSLGVATIAQAAIARYADVVHEHLGVPADRDIVCGVSFGYPDLGHPANGFRAGRADVSTVVSGLPELLRPHQPDSSISATTSSASSGSAPVRNREPFSITD
jgi:nitroreductase